MSTTKQTVRYEPTLEILVKLEADAGYIYQQRARWFFSVEFQDASDQMKLAMVRRAFSGSQDIKRIVSISVPVEQWREIKDS